MLCIKDLSSGLVEARDMRLSGRDACTLRDRQSLWSSPFRGTCDVQKSLLREYGGRGGGSKLSADGIQREVTEEMRDLAQSISCSHTWSRENTAGETQQDLNAQDMAV